MREEIFMIRPIKDNCIKILISIVLLYFTTNIDVISLKTLYLEAKRRLFFHKHVYDNMNSQAGRQNQLLQMV